MSEYSALVDRAHEYLQTQVPLLGSQRHAVFLAAQCRALIGKIQNVEAPITRDEATPLMASIQGGPWSGMQISGLSNAVDAAITRTDRTRHPENRQPQVCHYPEVFWTDAMWEKTLNSPRHKRIAEVVEFLIAMDLTHPDPKCKQRLVAMMGLNDSWISDNPTNAKSTMADLGECLKKARPPAASARPHIVNFPHDAAAACEVIEDFAERVYPGADNGPSLEPLYSSQDIDIALQGAVLRWSHRNVRDSAPRDRQGIQCGGGGSAVELRKGKTMHINTRGQGDGTAASMQQMQQQYWQQMQQMQQMQMQMAMTMPFGMPGMGMPGGMPGMGMPGMGMGMMPGMGMGMGGMQHPGSSADGCNRGAGMDANSLPL